MMMSTTRHLRRLSAHWKIFGDFQHLSRQVPLLSPVHNVYYSSLVREKRYEIMRGRRENEQLLYLNECLAEDRELSSSQWENIFKETFLRSGTITPISVTALTIGLCTANRNYKLALSLMKHLEKTKTEINTATLSKFLRICYESWPQSSEDVILNYYKQLCLQAPIMDATTAENAILSVSRTSCWKQGLELLESVKITCSPKGSVYSGLIEAAFTNGDVETGWALAGEAVRDRKKLKALVYSAWFNYCKTHDPSLEAAEKLFNYLSDFNLILPRESAKEVKNFMEQSVKPKWTGNASIITADGKCGSCGNELQKIQLTKEQFDELRNAFLERVVVGRDVFTKSTPQEVDMFKDFVKQSHPYDVVIDGLNIAYSIGATGNSASKLHSAAVRRVVENFINQGLKVMVLGRKHMLNWSKPDLSFIKRNARVFLANDLSQDDPFLLYATLHEGPQTYFASRDLMRGHAFKLDDPELKHLFQRWQQWRQFQVSVSKYTGKLNITPPMSFLPTAQKMENTFSSTWHIPCTDILEDSNTEVLDFPRHWLCIKTAKSK